MNPFAWSGLLAAISSLSFGCLVLLKSPHKTLSRIWFLFALTVAGYGFGVARFSAAGTPEMALFAIRLSYAFGVLWIASSFLHFVSVFLGLKNNRLVVINYIVSLGFCLIVMKPIFFHHARWVFDSMYYPFMGTLYPVYFVWWMSVVFYSHYQLILAYKTVEPQKRDQIKYFFLATAIGFTGGCTAYLPNFGIEIYPWGNFTVCLYPFIMAYAIIRHQLMDIRVVVRKTVLYLVGLLVAIIGYTAFVVHFTHREITPLANFSILTAVLSLGMSIFVFTNGRKRKIALIWALACLGIASWSFGFGMMARSQTFLECIFWQKWFLYLGAIMIPVLYLHFVLLLVGADSKKCLLSAYLCAFIFQILNFTGHLATAKLKPPFNFYTDAIFPVYHIYALFFFVIAVYAHWILFARIKTAEGALKNQIQYVFLGTSIGFLGGCMTFPLSFNIHIFPVGTYFVAFYLVAVTYAMYKHHLMDINLVLRKSLVYSLMTGSITAVYLIFITRGTSVLQNLFGASAISVSIIAACFITAIFLPLRTRIQSFVDSYFFTGWSDREMVREVAAGFSHELKSPLAGLSLKTQLMLAELEEVELGRTSWMKAFPKLKADLNYLLSQSMDAARRIEAVRGVAEPADGQMDPVEIAGILEAALVALEVRLAHMSVSVRLDLPVGLPFVRSNEKQLEIVFINLIRNALDAMEMGSKGAHELFFKAIERNDSVVFSIKDTGPGIAPKDIGHIFDAHFTTKGRKGTGMGLYLTHQIVKAHGGDIQVKSEEGKGAEFRIRLPKFASESRGGANEAA